MGQALLSIVEAEVTDAEALAAQALLREWDWSQDGEGRADALAALILRRLNTAIRKKEDLPDAEALLKAASAHLNAHFGRLDPPLGEALRLRRGYADLPLFGGPDALRAIGWKEAEDGRLVADFGDSFLMFVTWTADGDAASQSIQPFGSAVSHPESVHFSDQSKLFSSERMK